MEMPDDKELIEIETSEDEVAIEKMKAIIAEWVKESDDKRTEEARALLQPGADKN